PAIERARENHEKPGELRPFSNAERAEAKSWVSADLEQPSRICGLHGVLRRVHTKRMEAWTPSLRITERDGRVRLGLEGFGDVEGESLQEAADALVAYVLQVAMAYRSGGVGPLYSECSPDPAVLEFIWRVGELVKAGGDPRHLLFGPNPLAA